MAAADRDVLQFLANPSNREILSLLSVEPQYPRRLAELVGLSEDEASRRLRALERLGLAEAQWANVGRNVRLYRLSASRFQVHIDASGLTVTGVGGGGGTEPLALGRTAESPPDLPRFVGRDRELRELQDLLANQRAVCITGLGGAGKSSLAATLARRSGSPILWHTLSPGESSSLMLARLAVGQRELDDSEAGRQLLQLREGDDQQPLLRALLASSNARGTLLVLDRCEGASDATTATIAQLVRGLTQARLVLTSRSYLPGLPRDAVANYRLDGLDANDTAALVRSLGPDAVATMPARAQAIQARTGGHVLSVVLLAQAAEAARPAGPTDAESGVRGFLVDELLPQLSDTERDVLLALSVLRTPFLASEAQDITLNRHTGHALLRLESRSLVGRAGDRFVIHDLVRSFAAEVVPDRAAVHQRAARVLAASGEAVRVLEALHHDHEAGDHRHAMGLVREEASRRTFRFADLGLGPIYREALERLAATTQSAGERGLVDLELCDLATLAGDPEVAARHLRAAQAGLMGGDARLATRLALAEGRLLRLQGDGAQAAQRYLAAEQQAKAAGDDTLRLEVLVEAAFNEEEQDSGNAFRLYERARDLSAGTSDLRLLSLVYAGLSRVAAHLLDKRFLEWSDEALRLARLAGYLRGEASVYMAVTSHHIMHGIAGAEEWAVRYLDIANRLNDPWIRACALSDMAFMESRRARFESALGYAEECLRLAKSIRSPFYEIGALVVIAEVLSQVGRPAEALARARTLLDTPEGRLPSLVARLSRAAADACRRLGDEAGAVMYDKRAEAMMAASPTPDLPGPIHLAVSTPASPPGDAATLVPPAPPKAVKASATRRAGARPRRGGGT